MPEQILTRDELTMHARDRIMKIVIFAIMKLGITRHDRSEECRDRETKQLTDEALSMAASIIDDAEAYFKKQGFTDLA